MDLNSYAELAVRLVNTSHAGDGRQDELATVEAYQGLHGGPGCFVYPGHGG